MSTSLNKEINIFNVLKFTLPTILSMLCMSLYITIDGLFVSNFINTDALSAINIVFPAVNVFFAISVMIVTGSNAIIAKELGEKKESIARRFFSFIIFSAISISILYSSLILIFIEPILDFLGATERIYHYCYDYLFYFVFFLPFYCLQVLMQHFLVTAGRPSLGMFLTVFAGIVNIILDYFFIVSLDLGIKGAALATGTSAAIPAIVGLIYFLFFRKEQLHLVRPRYSFVHCYRTVINGSSEMVTNIAMALTTYLFNIMTLKFMGADGVSAITIILYAEYFLLSIFFGYSAGISPLFGYNLGANNYLNLKKLFRISMGFIVTFSCLIFLFVHFFSSEIVLRFAQKDNPVYDLTMHGLDIVSYAFFFMGFNIFASALFTALSNGKISGLLSFIRTFTLLAPFIYFLPEIFGLNGIWLAIPAAEFIAIFISIYFIWRMRKEYKYL